MRKTIGDALRTALAVFTAATLCSPALAQVDTFQREIPAADVGALKQAQALRDQKRQKEAVAVLESLVARRPDYFNAQYELGLALSDAPDDIPKAVPAFEKAVALKRSHSEITDAHVLNSLGWAYMYTGKTAKAEATLKEAESQADQLTPDVRKKLYNNLGYLYLNSGNPAQAERYLRIAAEKYESKQAQSNLATLEAVRKRQKFIAE